MSWIRSGTSIWKLVFPSDYSLKVVHKVTKGYPIFQTEVLDLYPQLNGGQQLGVLEACPVLPLHILVIVHVIYQYEKSSKKEERKERETCNYFQKH